MSSYARFMGMTLKILQMIQGQRSRVYSARFGTGYIMDTKQSMTLQAVEASECWVCVEDKGMPEHWRAPLGKCRDDALLTCPCRFAVGVRQMHNIVDAEAREDCDEN